MSSIPGVVMGESLMSEAMVCLLAAPRVQLSVSADSGCFMRMSY